MLLGVSVDVVGELVLDVFDHRFEELLLSAEVVVDRAPGDARGTGDLVDRHL